MKTCPKKTEGNTTGLTQVQEKTTQDKKNEQNQTCAEETKDDVTEQQDIRLIRTTQGKTDA